MPEIKLFPSAASHMARQVDQLFFYLVAVTGFFALLILVLITYYAIRYRRRREDEVPPPTVQNMRLEIIWIVIPTCIALSMFAWGAHIYVRMFAPPGNTSDIYIVGKQWMWKIQHPEGRREINTLHLPRGRPVRLILSSEDVIHSFFLPEFRIKHDVVPGRFQVVWLNPDHLGEFHFFCTQYCGTWHSRMVGTATVMEPVEYEAWLAGTVSNLPPAQAGEQLYNQLGCATCHGVRAPTLAGLYEQPVHLDNGQTVTADVNYLRESILDSTAKITAGYQPIMPSYRGQLSEEQLIQLIEYMKSLKNPEDVSRRRP